MRAVEARMKFQYDDQPSNVRRGASPVISLCAVGRPLWT